MAEKLQTRCVIAGGGPAGIMAGYLLARVGVPVIVLEKHADFFRDFRGDTIHPSTLELMYELGLLDEFLKQPHQEVRELRAVINGQTVPIADFTKLPTRCKFIAFMPQWDFLNFLSTQAKKFPSFQLLMQHEVVDLTFDQQRVTGVRIKTPDGELEIRTDLIIGADGRHSIVQARGGLERQEFGVPRVLRHRRFRSLKPVRRHGAQSAVPHPKRVHRHVDERSKFLLREVGRTTQFAQRSHGVHTMPCARRTVK